ncbi:hypothetical protein ABZP36_009202 [Zizania latifolia]
MAAAKVTVEEVRRAQRAEGPATVLAIGTATPANCFYQADYPDYYFRITKSEHMVDLKEKFKTIWASWCRELDGLRKVSNNILYPKDDREQKILLYACRNCDHQEVADIYCVYRNVVDHAAGEFTQVLHDVAGDPTLPRTKSVRCAACGHGEAVFFQATARGEEGMTLFFVCCNPTCGHRWRE